MRNFIIIALLGACASGCSSMASPQEVVLAPSELNTHPAQYDHAEVYVKGYLKLGPESHILYESKELDEEFKRRWDSGGSDFDPRNYQKYCLTIGNPDLLYKNRSKLVGQTLTIKGRFTAAYLDAQHIDLGACPLPTAIIIDEADLKQRYHLP